MVTLSGFAVGFFAVFTTALTLVVGGFWDACNLVNIPPIADAGGLTVDECYAMSASMMKAAPKGKEAAGELLVMFFHIVVRVEQNFFACSALAAWFALYQGPAARKVFHLFACLVSLCSASSDSEFAGLPGIGSTALKLSEASQAVIVIPFVPVWLLIGVLNGISFLKSPKEKTA